MRDVLGTFWSGYTLRRNHAYECGYPYAETGNSDYCWHVDVSRWDAFWWAASATWGFVVEGQSGHETRNWQLIGKATMTIVAVAVLWYGRRRRDLSLRGYPA